MMNRTEPKQLSFRERFMKFVPRIVKAIIITAIVGIVLLVFWVLLSGFLSFNPQWLTFFAVLIWAILLFTFAVRVSEGTIFKYGFIVGRAFFLIIFLTYVTNGGVLTLSAMGYDFTMEFVPILGLLIVACLLSMGKGILEAVEFVSESPKD
jgi:hypothetical protein